MVALLSAEYTCSSLFGLTEWIHPGQGKTAHETHTSDQDKQRRFRAN
jgi:hypothetical protein